MAGYSSSITPMPKFVLLADAYEGKSIPGERDPFQLTILVKKTRQEVVSRLLNF
jgi:hypothetical protein